jgi:hypothetical protein
VRACLHGGLEPESQSKGLVAESSEQEGNTGTNEKRCGAGEPRAACLRRVSPRVDRQVGVGISLKRARTVGSRRLRIDELGQAK